MPEAHPPAVSCLSPSFRMLSLLSDTLGSLTERTEGRTGEWTEQVDFIRRQL